MQLRFLQVRLWLYLGRVMRPWTSLVTRCWILLVDAPNDPVGFGLT